MDIAPPRIRTHCRVPGDKVLSRGFAEGRHPGPDSVWTLIDWLFRDRNTGRIVVAQFPNLPLWIFIVASVLRRALDPAGTAERWLTVIATGGLIWWAGDELARGVNPWRRILGGGVLAAQLVRLFAR